MARLRPVLLGVVASVVLLPATAFAGQSGVTAGSVVQMLFVLVGVCLLAVASLRWGLRRFVSADRGGAMEVVARLPLEPRRTLLAVRVGPRVLMLGSSEAGLQPVAELAPEEAEAFLAAIDVSRETSAPAWSSVSRETSEALP